MTYTKKVKKCYVLKCWMFSLEGRRLLLYHGGLGINIFPIMIDLYPDPNGNQHGSKPIVLGISIECKNVVKH
jgi:hypothetical protein